MHNIHNMYVYTCKTGPFTQILIPKALHYPTNCTCSLIPPLCACGPLHALHILSSFPSTPAAYSTASLSAILLLSTDSHHLLCSLSLPNCSPRNFSATKNLFCYVLFAHISTHFPPFISFGLIVMQPA